MLKLKLHKDLFSLALLAMLVSFSSHAYTQTATVTTNELVHIETNTVSEMANYVYNSKTKPETNLKALYEFSFFSLLATQNQNCKTQLQLQHISYLSFKRDLLYQYLLALTTKADHFSMII